MKPYTLPVLIVVVIVSIALSGMAYFTSYRTEKALDTVNNRLAAIDAKLTPVTPEAPVTSPPKNSDALDVSTWNTYENKPLGFRFKYPKAWDMKALTNEVDQKAMLALAFGTPTCQDCDQPPAMQVRVWSSVYNFDTNSLNLKAKDLADLVAKYAANSEPVYQDVKPIKVGGLSGYQADAGPDVFGGGRFILLPTVSGRLIELWFFEPDADGSRFSTSILPTFEF